ncbi:MAG TPA: UDP-N-acetylmuramoyl-tripeptide--D-alanyl-D-alanine ligase [Gemmatimonadales bacterium]|nr:UDP-N-acetylmuramoyl-tripeptide--D-alanyl-D-alanine ligase [Gemmatimonadales bacterium]
MTSWTGEQVAQALGVPAPAALSFTGVTTDTRHLTPGTLFVALKGERFDAHDFLGQAKAAGATGAVVRRGTPPVPGLTLFEVADTLTALGLLARARRRLLPKDAPVVAVTGSSGKTSAKEMIRSALATQRRVHATSGNLNNLVGVPLTILSAPDDANALVVEAGASLPGEIGKLRDIIEPTIAVVTNVGFAHLEGFGSTERLLQEKASLLDGAPVAVVGNFPALVAQAQRRARKVVVVARDEFGEVHPDKVDVDDAGQPILHWMGTSVTLPVLGLHQVDNAMIALAVAREAGVDLKAAVAGLANVQIPAGRGGLVSKGSLTIMDDSYNANPDSILAALETALTYAARRRRPLVVVLGSMLELGPESARLHAFVADELMSFLPAPEVVAAVGDFVPAFARYREALGERLITAPDAETLGPLLKRALRGNEIVLLKASRGVALERVLRHLT